MNRWKRRPAVAGTFYPRSPAVLEREVRELLERARPAPVEGRVVALIAPHAGYVYSGGVAAYAYKLVQGQPIQVVAVVAPSHQFYFPGVSVWPQGSFETPLGEVPVDEAICRRLLEDGGTFLVHPEAHLGEHSLEVQLPFLQVCLPGFRLVPLVMGDQELDTARRVGQRLAEVLGAERCLLVASSDLSHYHPQGVAEAMDRVVLERVEAMDAQGLSRALRERRCEACGAGPIMAVLLAARLLGANRAQVLRYATSGDVSGEREAVVGYLAAALVAAPSGETLGPEDRQALRRIALESIREALAGRRFIPPPPESPALRQPRGAFVTLRRGGALRGCIGTLVARRPLYEEVAQMALAAAFEDPRFPPLSAEELSDLELEISALTPLRRVQDPAEIEVGRHGLYIRRGPFSGVLLPQVAVEYGWDRETFLRETCRKAGLPPDAWRDPETEIYVFSAEVF